MQKYLMALDQGTTSSRCILFDKNGNVISCAQKEYPLFYPKEGWVEQDPMDIFSSQLSVAKEAVAKIGADMDEIYGIGITNQRETTILWDRATGVPIYNAIVWQCRRTASMCDTLRSEGKADLIRSKTGLVLDPYFCATKICWILENVPGAKEKAKRGELCFGTVDTWLMYNLSKGKIFATDVSNASRTMLFNLKTLTWDADLCTLFDIPMCILPEIRPSSSVFGMTHPSVLGASLPIGGVAGDQQSALFGQHCFMAGELKNTYGTGAFLLMNTGTEPYFTDNGLLTTVAFGIGDKTYYALEGSVFVCGAAIQWLRDGLKIIDSAADSEYYARQVEDTDGVYVVPAFTGLGAPYWDPYARGIIIGISRATSKSTLIRATVESMAYQTYDLVRLMENSTGLKIDELRIDGGAGQNSLLCEFQADLLGAKVRRPKNTETTAKGAALLAGLSLGVYKDIDEIRSLGSPDTVYTPTMRPDIRDKKIEGWHKAVERCTRWAID